MRLIADAELSAIYKRQYWDKAGRGLPVGLDYAVFDYAVNSGPAQAARDLQRVLGVKPDGIIGAMTLAAAQKRPAVAYDCIAVGQAQWTGGSAVAPAAIAPATTIGSPAAESGIAHVPLSGSPLVNSGTFSASPYKDARGLVRNVVAPNKSARGAFEAS